MSPPYIPATALSGDLVRDWTGPADGQRAERWLSGILVGQASDGRLLWTPARGIVVSDAFRLDPRRPEVAHRVADVLRAKGHEVGHLLPVSLGGRQGDVTALAEPTCTHPDCDEAAGHGGVHQTGNTRQIVTIPAADVSTVLLAASVAGVEAERGVVRGPATPWQQPYPSEPERWERSRPDWDGAGPRLLAGADSDRAWVRANCPPLPIDCSTPAEVRAVFWSAWMRERANGAVLVADCAWPVEARFLSACVDVDPEARRWTGPYPLHDVATARLTAGLDPLATTERRPNELPAHHPTCDARQSARLFLEALGDGREVTE